MDFYLNIAALKIGLCNIYLTPKRYHLKQNRLHYKLLFRKGSRRPDFNRLVEIEPKNMNNTLDLKIVSFRPKHPDWDQNPWFTALSDTTNITSLFMWKFPRLRAAPTIGCFFCFEFWLAQHAFNICSDWSEEITLVLVLDYGFRSHYQIVHRNFIQQKSILEITREP